jgi:hypothetical protein
VSSLHPGARDTTHGGIVKVRNADPVASTSSPSDLWHAWGAFRMDNADLELEIGFGWLRASRSALFRLLGNVRDLSGRSDLSPGANAK